GLRLPPAGRHPKSRGAAAVGRQSAAEPAGPPDRSELGGDRRRRRPTAGGPPARLAPVPARQSGDQRWNSKPQCAHRIGRPAVTTAMTASVTAVVSSQLWHCSTGPAPPARPGGRPSFLSMASAILITVLRER